MKKLLLILVFCVFIAPFVHSKVIENPSCDVADKAIVQPHDANFDTIDKESKGGSTHTATNLIFMGIVIIGMASLFQKNILKNK